MTTENKQVTTENKQVTTEEQEQEQVQVQVQVMMKKCNKGSQCLSGEALQSIENFSKRKSSPDGHTYTCKTCEAASARESYHRRKSQKKQQEYYKETREKRLDYHKEHYKKNKDKKLAYDAEYQKSEKGKEVMKKAHEKRRQALKENAGEPYTRWDVVNRDSVDGVLICQICMEPIEKLSDLHIDHIIPVIDGGIDELNNVRCTHKTCNLTRPKDGRDLEKGEADAEINGS